MDSFSHAVGSESLYTFEKYFYFIINDGAAVSTLDSQLLFLGLNSGSDRAFQSLHDLYAPVSPKTGTTTQQDTLLKYKLKNHTEILIKK